MAKKKQDDERPKETQSLRALGIERYETREVHRSLLKAHPCNPRTLTDEERRRLKRLLKKNGMLEPPVWNELSGKLVGGHQRVSILDTLVGHGDYTLTVAVVKLSEKAEKEALISLNNQEAQGEWDVELLGDLFKPGDLDLDATGFAAADIVTLFGEQIAAGQSEEALASLGEQLRKRREAQENHMLKLRTVRDSPNFYFVAVFNSQEERDYFLEQAGLRTDEDFQDGRQIARMAGHPVDED